MHRRRGAAPTATDIAFALGVLALIGPRCPANVRVFLLTLAIVDDIGAILVIAVVDTDAMHLVPLLVAAVLFAVVLALLSAARFLVPPPLGRPRRRRLRSRPPHLPRGVRRRSPL